MTETITKLDEKIATAITSTPKKEVQIDLLQDPYDAMEAIATLGVNFQEPVGHEQIGEGQRNFYATNHRGVTLAVTHWTRTPTEFTLNIKKP